MMPNSSSWLSSAYSNVHASDKPLASSSDPIFSSSSAPASAMKAALKSLNSAVAGDGAEWAAVAGALNFEWATSPKSMQAPSIATGTDALAKKKAGLAAGGGMRAEWASVQSFEGLPTHTKGGSPSMLQVPFVANVSAPFIKEEVGMAGMGAAGPPPFLTKTFDMVDDPSCNPIVSWGPANNSFIVWDPHALSSQILPRLFKHNNFSSFVRQLNTYGFRKVDPNRWEFASEGFLRGQKHLLKGIQRRKPLSTSQQQLLFAEVGPFFEVGEFGGLQGEIEGLQRDKNLLMLEVVRLQQQQQSTQQELSLLSQCLQSTEHKQQQMMTFLAKAMQNPTFVAQLMQMTVPTESLGSITRKRRLSRAGSSNLQDEGSVSSFLGETTGDGQLPDYTASPNNLNEELAFLLQEMARDEFSSKAGVKANTAVQDGSEVSMIHLRHQDSGKGEYLGKNAVKLEISNGFEDLRGTTLRTPDGEDETFWEQLFNVPNRMVVASADDNKQLGDQKSCSGETVVAISETIRECSEFWESKPDVHGATRQVVHLGSSP